MDTEKDNVLQFVDILKETAERGKELLPEALNLRSENVIKQLISGLLHAHGANTQGNTAKPAFGPITKILGQPVSTPSKTAVAKAQPTQQDMSELQGLVDEAWPTFLTNDAKALKAANTDLVIRAIANAAGMPVTATIPAKISADFVREVKAAVIAKDAQNKLANGSAEVDHVITQEDFDKNPNLKAKGLKVGDKIKVPVTSAA